MYASRIHITVIKSDIALLLPAAYQICMLRLCAKRKSQAIKDILLKLILGFKTFNDYYVMLIRIRLICCRDRCQVLASKILSGNLPWTHWMPILDVKSFLGISTDVMLVKAN